MIQFRLSEFSKCLREVTPFYVPPEVLKGKSIEAFSLAASLLVHEDQIFSLGREKRIFNSRIRGKNIDTWSVLYHFDTFRNPKNRFGHPEPFRQTAASLGIPGELVNRYTEKCDVWSFGVIVYIMFCGVPPFTGIHQGRVGDEEIFRKVERVSFFFVKARSFFSNNIYWTV